MQHVSGLCNDQVVHTDPLIVADQHRALAVNHLVEFLPQEEVLFSMRPPANRVTSAPGLGSGSEISFFFHV